MKKPRRHAASRTWLKFVAVLCAIARVAGSGPLVHADELDTVIANVQANERLFKDVELHWQTKYRLEDPRHKTNNMIAVGDTAGRCVSQGAMFFVEYRGHEMTVDGTKITVHRMTGFDGKLSRVLENRGSYIANIVEGPSFDGYAFNLFTVPLRRSNVRVPLSTWLRGREAIVADPRGSMRAGVNLKARCEGRETINGLECHKVVVDYFREGKGEPELTDRRVLWLAIARNYLPVRATAYNLFSSQTLPNEETVAEDFKELATGIWYPARLVHTVYDEGVAREDGRLAVAWRDEHTIEKIRLNPDHEVAFFQRVAFPEGVPVYRVRDGKIVEASKAP